MFFRLLSRGCGLLVLTTLSFGARAQTTRPPAFYTTYAYTAYTVFENDSTSVDPPTKVSGVGGTLTLHPAGTYEKRLSIKGPNGLMQFRQDGRFTLSGDSIRFAFTDQKGDDVQRGTYRYVPASRRLTITIFGYPAGNKGVYELVQTNAPKANGTHSKAARKRHP
jgi:hypothetical protein